MRIFFFIDAYPYEIGGMETHAQSFIKRYRRSPKDTLHVIGFTRDPALQGITADGIRLLPSQAIHDARIVIATLSPFTPVHGDVIFFNSLYWIEIAGALKQAFPHVLFVLRSGGNDVVQAPVSGVSPVLYERQRYIASVINESIDVMIVNSEYSYRRSRVIGIDASRMYIVRGGAPMWKWSQRDKNRCARDIRSRHAIPSNGFVWLCVCRLVEFKGIIYLLHAFKRLRRSHDAHLLIVGDGPLKEQLIQTVSRLSLQNVVTFAGAVEQKQILQYYLASDAYVLTPVRTRVYTVGGSYIHTETMGRSICEARAAGLPIVTTRVGGIPEIVDAEQGIILPDRDSAAIAQAMAAVTRSKNARKAFSRTALRRRDEISWKHVFDRYDAIIRARGIVV